MNIKRFVVIIAFITNSTLHAQFYTIRGEYSVSNINNKEKQQGEQNSIDSVELSTEEVLNRASIDPIGLQCSLPLKRDLYITSLYGYRQDPITKKKRFHHGIDLRCKNDKVLAVFFGKVKKVGYSKHGLGNYVVLSHKFFEITYGHLEYVLVEKGDKVRPGMIVGISGSTGRTTGYHLHIEMKYRGKRCDPLPLLAFLEKTIKLQHKINTHTMDKQEKMALTALEHVQDVYSEEYKLFLQENSSLPSEETALLFLEDKEQEILSSEEDNIDV